jgi:hypothetical protein
LPGLSKPDKPGRHRGGTQQCGRNIKEKMMQYLLMIYVDEAEAAKIPPEQMQQLLPAYFAYTEAMKKAGVWIGSDRLRRTDAATTVRVRDDKPQVLDGPYADTKEQLAGYFKIEAPDLDAAITWAARCPGASHGIVEVRPIWEMEAA